MEGASLTGDGNVLVVSFRGAAGAYPLRPGKRLVVGRGDGADIAIDDPAVSRRHAEIDVGVEIRLIDCGSRNGTRVGDERLAARESRVIALGDVVRIGRAILIVQARGAPGPAFGPAVTERDMPRPLRDEVAEIERGHILKVLEECGGNQTRAARELGISRSTLNQRLDLYQVPRPRKKAPTKPL